MNWLAHVFLSTADPEEQLGNLLADVVRGAARERLGPAFMRGAMRHQRIDAFTDAHPLVRHSRARLGPTHRRFSGVLVDVFYDHLLANEWEMHSETSLRAFTLEFYAAARAAPLDLPADARELLERIIQHDVLHSYLDVRGVEESLSRLSWRLAKRWGRPFALERSVEVLLEQREGFLEDFRAFFPALRADHAPSEGG